MELSGPTRPLLQHCSTIYETIQHLETSAIALTYVTHPPVPATLLPFPLYLLQFPRTTRTKPKVGSPAQVNPASRKNQIAGTAMHNPVSHNLLSRPLVTRRLLCLILVLEYYQPSAMRNQRCMPQRNQNSQRPRVRDDIALKTTRMCTDRHCTQTRRRKFPCFVDAIQMNQTYNHFFGTEKNK